MELKSKKRKIITAGSLSYKCSVYLFVYSVWMNCFFMGLPLLSNCWKNVVYSNLCLSTWDSIQSLNLIILCWQEKDILILECVFCVHSGVISPLNFIATCKIFEEHPLFISNITLGNFLSVIIFFVTSYGFTENCLF